VADQIVELPQVPFEDGLNTSELVAVGTLLLRHLLDILDIALLSRFWVVLEVIGAVFEPLLISFDFLAVVLLLLLICLLFFLFRLSQAKNRLLPGG